MRLFTESGVEVLSVEEYIEKYHPTITTQIVRHHVQQGKLNGFKKAGSTFVVLDDLALSYKPRSFKGLRS